jgi:hypothetical protein
MFTFACMCRACLQVLKLLHFNRSRPVPRSLDPTIIEVTTVKTRQRHDRFWILQYLNSASVSLGLGDSFPRV